MRRRRKKSYKYCKIHKQEFMDFLHECPICCGEKMGKELQTIIDTKKPQLLKRRRKSQLKIRRKRNG